MDERELTVGGASDRAAAGSAAATVLGGLLLVAGSLLPWASFSSMLNVFSVNAIESGAALVPCPSARSSRRRGLVAWLGRDIWAPYVVPLAAIALLTVAVTAIAYQFAILPPRWFGWIVLDSHAFGMAIAAGGAVLAIIAGLPRDRVRRSGVTVLLAVALALTLWAIRGQVELAIGAAACLERAKFELILCVDAPPDGLLILGAAVAVGLAILLGVQFRRDRA